MIITITLSSIILLLLWRIYFMIKKQEYVEDVAESQQNYVNKLAETVKYCDERIKQIDSAGTFASDDAIGWWFEEVKEMQKLLNQYGQ